VTPAYWECNISKTAGDAIQQQSLLLDSLLCGSRPTVGYPSDSLASCALFRQIDSKKFFPLTAIF